MGAAVLSSCSRPVAYVQKAPREHFATVQKTAPVTAPVEAVAAPAPVVAEAAPVAPQAEQVAQAKEAVAQLEAYVSADSKLASNKKLTKRLAHVNEMLAAKATAPTTTAAKAHKLNVVEKLMLKKMDKKLKSQLAPEDAKVMNSNVRNGIIIGAIGLILGLLFGGVLGVIGYILLVVGIVLILLGILA